MKKEVFVMLLILLSVSVFIATGTRAMSEEGTLSKESYIGSEKCKDCHENIAMGFSANIHSKAGYYGAKDGCESCHGPAGAHVETGDKTSIVNPAKMAAKESTEACLKCHNNTKNLMFWKGSAHNSEELNCTSCHQMHTASGRKNLLKQANEKGVCFDCHLEIRSLLFKRSKHPLRDSTSPSSEGKMTCSDCHNPHGAMAEKMIAARSVNDKCYECHAEKRAPVLWEHAPVKENCLVCHSAHGSSNDKLLTTTVPRLCQECHMQGRHQTGTLGTNSVYAFNRGCLNCHPMVHGSNNPSGPVLQR